VVALFQNRKRLFVVLSVLAVMLVFALSASAQYFPTPEAVDPVEAGDMLNGSVSLLQLLGIIGVIPLALLLIFAPRLFRRFTGGSR